MNTQNRRRWSSLAFLLNSNVCTRWRSNGKRAGQKNVIRVYLAFGEHPEAKPVLVTRTASSDTWHSAYHNHFLVIAARRALSVCARLNVYSSMSRSWAGDFSANCSQPPDQKKQPAIMHLGLCEPLTYLMNNRLTLFELIGGGEKKSWTECRRVWSRLNVY